MNYLVTLEKDTVNEKRIFYIIKNKPSSADAGRYLADKEGLDQSLLRVRELNKDTSSKDILDILNI